MNAKPLNAAYEVMTSQELAAVAYAHADNELETMRIKAAIPRKTYSMPDAEFVDTLNKIHTMVLVWMVECWKANFLFAAETAIAFNAMNKGDYTKANDYLDNLVCKRGVMATHIAAFKEVCSNHGIDYKTVLARFGISDSNRDATEIDLEYKISLIKDLEMVLEID